MAATLKNTNKSAPKTTPKVTEQNAEAQLPLAQPDAPADLSDAIQKAIANPEGLDPNLLDLLRGSSEFHTLLDALGRDQPKKLSEEDVSEFKMLLATLGDFYTQVGRLEYQKSEYLKQIAVLEQQQEEFIHLLGRRYNIPPNTKITLDLEAGEIRMK